VEGREKKESSDKSLLCNMEEQRNSREGTMPLSFSEFLEKMKDPKAADLVRSIKVWV
jgi:hypothetical protein